jgi:trigger factor
MVRGYLERVMPAREGADAERVQEAAADVAGRRARAQAMLVWSASRRWKALHATPAELEERIDELAERLGRPRGEVLGQLRKSGRLDELEQEITEEKVFEYLKSLSDVQ